jgi:hypothetical protein
VCGSRRRCELIFCRAGQQQGPPSRRAAAAVPNQHLGVSDVVSCAVVLPLRLGSFFFSVVLFLFFCSFFRSRCSLFLFRYRASGLSLGARRSTKQLGRRSHYIFGSSPPLACCSFFRSRCPLSLSSCRASALSLEARSTNLAAAPAVFVSSPPPACCSATVDAPTPSSVCVFLLHSRPARSPYSAFGALRPRTRTTHWWQPPALCPPCSRAKWGTRSPGPQPRRVQFVLEPQRTTACRSLNGFGRHCFTYIGPPNGPIQR